jgi:hypothetical protein
MGELLGIGCTHAPHLQFTDEAMANVLRRLLKSDRLPPHLRDPENWPEGMRAEWADDEAAAAARRHREIQVEAFRQARAVLDEFRPDFVLIWGDDQFENFKLDLLTPFCVFALDPVPLAPFHGSDGLGAAENVWNEPTDLRWDLPGHQGAANHLAHELVRSGFDVSCAYRLHHAETLSHAFTRTVLYLDYDRRGFDYPVIPFHVNCYGSNLRVRPTPLTDRDGNVVRPPPSPPPWRCYDLGRRIAEIIEASPWRAALIGSSSWSHATLTEKHHFLYPDVEMDRKRLAQLRGGALHEWRDLTTEQMVDSGQHEMLNWVCLAGAMEGRQPDVLAYTETYIFNSDKALAVFPAARR